ncbi:MAG: lytic transglycosylase domain-containing protein [Burkholderiales bacterium]|nr:lytic transglycosylase domain-containing protein [Burkholderiales bacterium]
MPPAGRVAACDERPAAWADEIAAAAAASGVDAALIGAVVWAESRCNPRARSPKGAMGLMQLMPATARAYGVADAYDPAQNLRAGARYLRDLLALFNGDVALALAAYNAGPRSVVAARMAIPPYRETRAYVPAVLARWRTRSAG